MTPEEQATKLVGNALARIIVTKFLIYGGLYLLRRKLIKES